MADLISTIQKAPESLKGYMKLQIQNFAVLIGFAFVLALPVLTSAATAAESKSSSEGKERQLINVLQSNASPSEKAITCKKLAVYGTKEAVPALAVLLSDDKLASWARIPLEVIPGPAPDKALRDAVANLQGKILIGVINSIGVRRDPKAVSILAAKLEDSDANVAIAAAESLGRIGGSGAAKALKSRLATTSAEVRSAVAEGCIRCAERFMNDGKRAEAVKLYDLVRSAEVPGERMLEATRGAILARQSKGLPLLLEQLRSPDKSRLEIGLHTARELPGQDVTSALAAELHQCAPERQPLLLLALAERGDATALPTILEAARSGPKKLRSVAVEVLDRSGNPATLPVLLEVASANDPELAQAAKSAIGRLPGNGVDNDILARLAKAEGKNRQVLLEVAGRRGMESALPIMLRYSESPDAGTRSAALTSIGTIGGDRETSALVKLLQKNQNPDTRADIGNALMGISGRTGPSCAQTILPLAQSKDTEVRLIALRTLAAAGGPAALGAVRSATEDNEEVVRDEAVRTLSSWPNTWPEDSLVADPLLALAKSAQKPSHQVLAVRGFLQFLLGDEKLKSEEKLRRVNEVLPLLNRPEDKRLAIAVIRQIPNPAALELLTNFAGEPDIAEDASAAIIDVASQTKSGLPKEARQKALQTVLEKSANDATKKKADDALKKLG